MKNRKFLFILILLNTSFIFALPFNSNLKPEELEKIENHELIIRNIIYSKYMCLDSSFNNQSNELSKQIIDLQPKYLAESILLVPKEDNENLPEKLETLLNNVNDYAGIPYFSERGQTWYNLYDSAETVSTETEDSKTKLNVILTMSPFDKVYEDIEITKVDNTILYTAVNTNKLRYLDQFDCVWPYKMKMCILLLDDGENWVLYGIGGVNAPRIPFFTERIQTSFINRINTFCSFMFNKLLEK